MIPPFFAFFLLIYVMHCFANQARIVPATKMITSPVLLSVQWTDRGNNLPSERCTTIRKGKADERTVLT